MKTVFNSLGSNYSLSDVLLALKSLFFSEAELLRELKDLLKYDSSDQVVLTYKGRDAIQIACEILLPKNSLILTQALSCFAVEEGMLRAGMKPVYVDIQGYVKSEGVVHTNPSLTLLRQRFQEFPEARAVFIQHSLGTPAEITKISQWCKENKLLLIEDLAQAYGAVDAKNQKLGMQADVVIFSFGRDKIIDAISGGAVVFRTVNKKITEKISKVESNLKPISFGILFKDMMYPLVTFCIRTFHSIQIGKLLYVIFKKFGFLSSPVISLRNYPSSLHPAYAKLAVKNIQNINQQLEHRKNIALQYATELKKNNTSKIVLNATQSELMKGSNQRFNITTDSPETLDKVVQKLKENKIYISDRWYRSAVDCGSYNCSTGYVKGECSTAEYIADRLLNLPTHKNITQEQAKNIIQIISKAVLP